MTNKFIDVDGELYNLDYLVRVTKNEKWVALHFVDQSSVNIVAEDWSKITDLIGAEFVSVKKHDVQPAED